MKSPIIRTMILCLVFSAGVTLLTASAQPDQEVRARQEKLKEEYNTLRDNNQLVRQTAKDKTVPRTGRRSSRPQSIGYDFTQVKGFNLRKVSMNDRIDLMFKKAAELGLLDEAYYPNGPNTVPCQHGQGSASISRIEYYVVEATKAEIDEYNLDPVDLIEVRVIKSHTCPDAPTDAEEGEDGGLLLNIGGGGSQPVQYILSGRDLWAALKAADEMLYDDLLSTRNSDADALDTPRPETKKRGPFIVKIQGDLETATSRFVDFWNTSDTLTVDLPPEAQDAAGPLYKQSVPVVLENSRAGSVKITNPDNTALTITKIEFIGEMADAFKVVSVAPMVLGPKSEQLGSQQVKFEYVGSSPYQTGAQLLIQSQNGKFSQTIDILANPGRKAVDAVVLDLSLDKIELRSPSRSGFAPDWRLAYAMGNPEIGLPRWGSGMSTLSIGYKHQMSMGLVMPMNMTSGDLPTPLAYDNTLLFSPMGYNIAFDFTFGFPFSLGGSITITDRFEAADTYQKMHLMTTTIDGEKYENNFFNISTAALVYYPIMFTDNDGHENDQSGMLVRLSVGGGFQRIERDYFAKVTGNVPWVDGTQKSVEASKLYWMQREKDLFDVFIRFDFINTGARNNYGLGAQYFSGRLMADAWLELTEWLRVEAKYSFLLRNREVWESENSFFMLTPRFRLGLPSLFK